MGHTIVVTAYYPLRRKTAHQKLGTIYPDERERRLIHRLQRLGYKVTLDPVALAA